MKYDWLRDYEDQDLEAMELSAEERERVLQNALNKLPVQAVPERKPILKKKKRRFSRAFGLLAAALAAGLLTAGAAGFWDAGGILYQIFGAPADPEMVEALGVACYPIGQSQTQGGYTVTLQGVIGDRKSCYLVFDVAAPEGTVLNNRHGYGFAHSDFTVGSIWSGSGGYFLAPLDDTDPTDSVVSFLLGYDGEFILPGKECSLSLQTFLRYVDDSSGDGEWDNEKIVADETWDFTFRMEYEDVSRKVPVRQALRYGSSEARLTGIYISPLSVHLEYQQPVLERLFGEKQELGESELRERSAQETQHHPAVVLHFRDGTEFAVGIGGDGQIHGGLSSSSGSSGVTRVRASYSFDRPINTAELVSVDIDGVNFPAG